MTKEGNLIHFASENFAGVHPEIMRALEEANRGHARSYGKDPFTADTVSLFNRHFGDDIEVYFSFNGTGANNFGLGCVTDRHQSVFCSDTAHLYVDESTAPETFVGCRLYPLRSESGKISADELRRAVRRVGDIHHPQPGTVSITQPTEYGTVYSPEELCSLRAVCDEYGLLLHMDGSRFFNAAVRLGSSLMQASRGSGIDILTLGGTKAGMMFGEAVIFFGSRLRSAYPFHLKRSMQLASKHRFLSVQFRAMLENDLWRDIAVRTNELAGKLEKAISTVPQLKIAHPVETNAVFVHMSPSLYEKLQRHARFYYWNELKNEARFMLSFDNTEEEINRFSTLLQDCAADEPVWEVAAGQF